MKRLSLAVLFSFFVFSCYAGEIGGIILAPKTLPQGNQVSITVTTSNLETQEPVSAPVIVRLLDPQGSVTTQIFSGSTNDNGIADISFLVPPDIEGSFTIQADSNGIIFEAGVTVVKGPAILIETDKPIYQPGQTIQGRILLVNNELKPFSGEAELVIKDGKGIRVDRRKLETNEFGAASFSLPLANQLDMGTWNISAECGKSTTELAVRVEKYVLPQFSIDVEFSKNWFLPEEEITADITSNYFFGKKVEGQATVAASRYTGVWEEYASVTTNLVDGAGSFTLPPVEFTAGTDEYGGDGAVTLNFTVTDTSGHSETTNRILKIAAAPVEVQIIAKQKFVKPTLPFSLLLITQTPSGIPQDRTVDLTITFNGEEGQISENTESITTVNGEALYNGTVPKGTLSCFLSAELNEDGHTSKSDLTLFASHSPSASFLHLSYNNTEKVQVGQKVTVKAFTTNSGSLFWEVLSSGRVLRSAATREREFSFTATSDMIPKIEVVGYTLNPGDELACDTLSIPVELSSRLELDASFSKKDARPGEEVTLTVNAHRKSLIGISVVDESLLALADEQLTLKSVFDQLEECFMTPQAEIHFDNDPWAPVTIPGTEELLFNVGIAIGYSRGISVPAASQADSWIGWGPEKFRDGDMWLLMDGVAGPPEDANSGGTGNSNGYAEVERVRQFFPETWVWRPTLLTDENGEASLSLTCPDSITSWHMKAISSSSAGMAMAEDKITVFQNFFVQPDLPIEVVRGEVFPLKLQVYNYAEESQDISLKLESADWFELQDPAEGSVSVGPNEVTSMVIHIKPVKIGKFPLNITALGKLHSDAIIKNLSVVPEGVKITNVQNGKISQGEDIPIEISYPPEYIPDSGQTVVSITPSLIAQTMSGLDDLIGMPYGCGEQNMMFFAPDVEVLRYLLLTGEAYPEIWAKAEHFINVGYQRELTYRRNDHSFSAFGEQDEKGSLYLTAFVLSSFSKARDVKDIDDSVLEEAAEWIKSHQGNDGSWEPFGFLCHSDLDGGLDGTYSLTAYVAKSLAEYDPESSQAELAAAKNYLSANRSSVSDQAYPLAVAAYALSIIPNAEDDMNATLDMLMLLAKTDKNGIHWEPYPIETTAYAALALINADRPQAQDAIDYIASHRGALGGYGNTQDTVVAFQAVTQAALSAIKDVNASINLYIDNDLYKTFTVNKDNYDLLQSVEIPKGSSKAMLSLTGKSSIGYQIARHFNIPGNDVPPQRNMLISVEYQTEHVAVDDVVDVNVKLNYTGMREKTNMVIADVGVPTGFSIVQSSLDKLVDDEIVSRIEVAIRKVIFYLPELIRGEEVSFTFQVKALFPIKAAPVSSTAYDYYDPEDKGIDSGSTITVGNALFIRGDANRDKVVDISDAVTILLYLYSGGDLTCMDAADVNDNGKLDLSDPIYLLSHLFADSEAPPAPWGTEAEDPTPDDGIGCAL